MYALSGSTRTAHFGLTPINSDILSSWASNNTYGMYIHCTSSQGVNTNIQIYSPNITSSDKNKIYVHCSSSSTYTVYLYGLK